jgi:hypothetical protein
MSRLNKLIGSKHYSLLLLQENALDMFIIQNVVNTIYINNMEWKIGIPFVPHDLGSIVK